MAVLYNSTSVLQAENELDLVSSYRRWQQNWNILHTVVETEKQRGQKSKKQAPESQEKKKKKRKSKPNPAPHWSGRDRNHG